MKGAPLPKTVDQLIADLTREGYETPLLNIYYNDGGEVEQTLGFLLEPVSTSDPTFIYLIAKNNGSDFDYLQFELDNEGVLTEAAIANANGSFTLPDFIEGEVMYIDPNDVDAGSFIGTMPSD